MKSMHRAALGKPSHIMTGQPYVIVQNESKGTVLAGKARVASTCLRRAIGLLGRSGIDSGEGLILVPCRSIHTFFMRFPIDVVFMDKEFRVLLLEENMQPFRVSPYLPGAYCVLEIPTGTITDTATAEGDMLSVTPCTPCR